MSFPVSPSPSTSSAFAAASSSSTPTLIWDRDPSKTKYNLKTPEGKSLTLSLPAGVNVGAYQFGNEKNCQIDNSKLITSLIESLPNDLVTHLNQDRDPILIYRMDLPNTGPSVFQEPSTRNFYVAPFANQKPQDLFRLPNDDLSSIDPSSYIAISDAEKAALAKRIPWLIFLFKNEDKAPEPAPRPKSPPLEPPLSPRSPKPADPVPSDSSKKPVDTPKEPLAPLTPIIVRPKFSDVFTVASLVSNLCLALITAIAVVRDGICRDPKTSKGIRLLMSVTLGVSAAALFPFAVVEVALRSIALFFIHIATLCSKPKWLVDFKVNQLALAPAALLVTGRVVFHSLLHTWKYNTPIFKEKLISANDKKDFEAKKTAELASLKNPLTLLSKARELANMSYPGALERNV